MDEPFQTQIITLQDIINLIELDHINPTNLDAFLYDLNLCISSFVHIKNNGRKVFGITNFSMWWIDDGKHDMTHDMRSPSLKINKVDDRCVIKTTLIKRRRNSC